MNKKELEERTQEVERLFKKCWKEFEKAKRKAEEAMQCWQELKSYLAYYDERKKHYK